MSSASIDVEGLIAVAKATVAACTPKPVVEATDSRASLIEALASIAPQHDTCVELWADVSALACSKTAAKTEVIHTQDVRIASEVFKRATIPTRFHVAEKVSDSAADVVAKYDSPSTLFLGLYEDDAEEDVLKFARQTLKSIRGRALLVVTAKGCSTVEQDLTGTEIEFFAKNISGPGLDGGAVLLSNFEIKADAVIAQKQSWTISNISKMLMLDHDSCYALESLRSISRSLLARHRKVEAFAALADALDAVMPASEMYGAADYYDTADLIAILEKLKDMLDANAPELCEALDVAIVAARQIVSESLKMPEEEEEVTKSSKISFQVIVDDARERFVKATWTRSYINTLSDGSFLYISPGGEKDSEGKTTPRSLRHFPYKDKDGKIDLPHLRNAIARIPQSKIPADKKKSLQARAQKLLETANKRLSFDLDDSGNILNLDGEGIQQQNTEKQLQEAAAQEAATKASTVEKAAIDDIIRLANLALNKRVQVGKSANDGEAAEERFVLGVVLEPEPSVKEGEDGDTQGDTYTADTVRKTAHDFMAHYRNVGFMHKRLINNRVDILESYLAPQDLVFKGEDGADKTLKAGTWLMGFRVKDDSLWEGVKTGKLTGLSIGGVAIRHEVE